MKVPRVILASRSPERRRLLKELVDDLEIEVSDVDESRLESETLEDWLLRVARAKAHEVTATNTDLVIAADTTIVFKGEPLGKPEDVQDAAITLTRLAGHEFEVLTGACALERSGHEWQDLSHNRVKMKEWRGEELDEYLASGRWKGRAGGFSIAEENSPVALIKGEIESVCGLSVKWAKMVLGEICR